MVLHTMETAKATEVRPTRTLLDQLEDAGLLLRTGVDGLYIRTAAYQEVADGIDAMVSRWAATLHATRLHMPPLIPRTSFERTNYLESFPDLMGSVHVFAGGEVEHRQLLQRATRGHPWSELLQPSELMLEPAVCHGVYPLCARRPGSGPWLFDVSGHCFRSEPSKEPTRLQSFLMHEVVYVGEAAGAEAHRDMALDRGQALLESLGLEVAAVPASDPFFGRVGNVLAASQLDEQLKTELVTEVPGNSRPTALLSANYHRDHFGRSFGIETTVGELAHSACVGFGVDRIAIALLATQGLDPSRWAPSLRSLLRL